MWKETRKSISGVFQPVFLSKHVSSECLQASISRRPQFCMSFQAVFTRIQLELRKLCFWSLSVRNKNQSSSAHKVCYTVLSPSTNEGGHNTNLPANVHPKRGGESLQVVGSTEIVVLHRSLWEVIVHEGDALNSCEVRLDEKITQVETHGSTQPWHKLRTLQLMAAVIVLANFQRADPKLPWGSEHPHLGCKKLCQELQRTRGETYRCCLLAREAEEIAKVSFGSLEMLIFGPAWLVYTKEVVLGRLRNVNIRCWWRIL